eukprot:9225337-Pyramimonas_sp.AAC.1
MELIDDDPLRENLRDAGDRSERIQYEHGHNDEFQCALVSSDRSASRPKRSPSRPALGKKNYRDDDEDHERGDNDRTIRRGRAPSHSPDRARARP